MHYNKAAYILSTLNINYMPHYNTWTRVRVQSPKNVYSLSEDIHFSSLFVFEAGVGRYLHIRIQDVQNDQMSILFTHYE